MRKYALPALICLNIGMQSCLSIKNKTLQKQKYQHLNQIIEKSVVQKLRYFDLSLETFGKYIKTHGGYNKVRNAQLSDNAYLGRKLNTIISDLTKVKWALGLGKIYQEHTSTKEFINSPQNYLSAKWLAKTLNKYSKLLTEHFPQHLKDTASWNRRYIKTLPKTQQERPPSFATFYFKGVSLEEAIVILSTLQLGITKEALEIQHQILKE
ncbi:hypothetical protein [uncultured Microscilla sp.]|uniref:hypothetical protein n=1 Tax=uncultured Microscilla sp. TaxID=432653 RepID=UPI00261DD153|nr:hypothetical protein [uncultured Microscilla sp.]